MEHRLPHRFGYLPSPRKIGHVSCIALRNGRLAVVWLDKNTNLLRNPELAVRIFQLPK
jgi:hypothetical protein